MTEGRPRIGDVWWMLGLALLVLLSAAIFVFRGDILRSWLDPRTPYQAYRPPPAPDYGARPAWALIPPNPAAPSASDPEADVFFVHPTSFEGGKDWNGPIGDPRADKVLTRVLLPNYAGPFARIARLFGPRYRQASLFSQLTLKDDAREARAFAYDDVRRAFDVYLARYWRGRPLIIVGVEQGGTLAERLAREAVAAHPELRERLAAVYLIDTVALADDHRPGSPLPACERRDQAGCVVGWTQSWAWDEADIRRTLTRSLVWSPDGELDTVNGRDILCVNPLLGARTDAPAAARLNLGAANASDVDWGTRPAFLSRQVSARCDRGVLRVSKPPSPSLKDPGGAFAGLREPGYNLFYADEEADALARLAALKRAGR